MHPSTCLLPERPSRESEPTKRGGRLSLPDKVGDSNPVSTKRFVSIVHMPDPANANNVLYIGHLHKHGLSNKVGCLLMLVQKSSAVYIAFTYDTVSHHPGPKHPVTRPGASKLAGPVSPAAGTSQSGRTHQTLPSSLSCAETGTQTTLFVHTDLRLS